MASLLASKTRIPRVSYNVDTEQDIAKLCEIIPGWENSRSNNEALKVEPISGGITNRIYKLSNPSRSPQAVLVRIFGGENLFTAAEREQENEIFEQLGQLKVAPKLIALFGNGRVETFLHSRAIILDEMVDPIIMAGVANEMAKLHKYEPYGNLQLNRSPGVWADMDKWVPEALNLRQKEAPFVQQLSVDLDECVKGLKRLRQSLDDENSRSPIVFCHNDLLCGNILRSLGEEASVSIVDFEYSSFNYRGFDIGNFFCEAMGGTQDGFVDTSRYPTESMRRQFCKTYIKQFNGFEPDKASISQVVAEAEKYGLIAHLYWGFWALVQSVSSPVDFPYALFADQRFRCFLANYSGYSVSYKRDIA